jgi:hypothetical protein
MNRNDKNKEEPTLTINENEFKSTLQKILKSSLPPKKKKKKAIRR